METKIFIDNFYVFCVSRIQRWIISKSSKNWLLWTSNLFYFRPKIMVCNLTPEFTSQHLLPKMTLSNLSSFSKVGKSIVHDTYFFYSFIDLLFLQWNKLLRLIVWNFWVLEKKDFCWQWLGYDWELWKILLFLAKRSC